MKRSNDADGLLAAIVLFNPADRAAGTNTEGGAFESFYAALVLYRDERIASFEFFEPEELDVALARLAEVGA